MSLRTLADDLLKKLEARMAKERKAPAPAYREVPLKYKLLWVRFHREVLKYPRAFLSPDPWELPKLFRIPNRTVNKHTPPDMGSAGIAIVHTFPKPAMGERTIVGGTQRPLASPNDLYQLDLALAREMGVPPPEREADLAYLYPEMTQEERTKLEALWPVPARVPHTSCQAPSPRKCGSAFDVEADRQEEGEQPPLPSVPPPPPEPEPVFNRLNVWDEGDTPPEELSVENIYAQLHLSGDDLGAFEEALERSEPGHETDPDREARRRLFESDPDPE